MWRITHFDKMLLLRMFYLRKPITHPNLAHTDYFSTQILLFDVSISNIFKAPQHFLIGKTICKAKRVCHACVCVCFDFFYTKYDKRMVANGCILSGSWHLFSGSPLRGQETGGYCCCIAISLIPRIAAFSPAGSVCSPVTIGLESLQTIS